MEVIDINILLAEPVPFSLERFARLSDTLVDGTTNLEAGLVKIGLNEDGEGLVLLILDINLLGDQVEGWQLTGFGPRICFQIKHCGLLFFCSTDEKDLSDFVVGLLSRNSGSGHLFWRFTKRLERGLCSFHDGHLETLLENHGVFEWENQVLEFGELDDILRQDITILLHNVLLLIQIILPQLLKVKNLLDLIDSLVGENVLSIVTPLVFLKIDFSDRCSIRKMQGIKYGIFDKQMELHVATWI